MWPFKKKVFKLVIDRSPEKVTLLHPDYKRLIEHSFDIEENGKVIEFYCFKEIHDMPSERYGALNNFITDNNRKMTNEELLHYSDECLKEINNNNPESLANVVTILKMMKMRAEYVMNLDMVMRLVSCAFFTIDEELLSYDWDIGDWKIELFKKHGLKSFFLSKPIREWLPVTNISDGDMEVILQERQIMEAWLKELRGLGISTINPYDTKNRLKKST